MPVIDVDVPRIDELLAVMRKHNVRAFEQKADGGFEVVLEPLPVPEKQRDPDAPPADGDMPTRAQIEEAAERIRKGGLK